MDRQVERIHNMNEAARQKVIALCEQEGFGFVIVEASREWQRRDPGHGFSIGPCIVFTTPCSCKQQAPCEKCYGCGWQFQEGGGMSCDLYEEGCLFPGQCLMVGFHLQFECHTVEMIESQYEDEEIGRR